MPDHQHHVAGDVDQVAHLQPRQLLLPLRQGSALIEGHAVQHRAARLVAGIAWQRDAEAAIDIQHEAAAIARGVIIAPAVALAQELERLAQQCCIAERQRTDMHIRTTRHQRRHQLQITARIALWQFHHVRGERQLPVDRRLWRPARQQRQVGAHVQGQCGDRRQFRRVGALHACASHHQARAALCVVEHLGARAHRQLIICDPGGVVFGQHKAPRTIGTGVQHGDRRAGVERRLLKPVDIAVVGSGEHPLRGREGAQGGALHHQGIGQRDSRG